MLHYSAQWVVLGFQVWKVAVSGRTESSPWISLRNEMVTSVLRTILSWRMVTTLLAILVLPIVVKGGRISFTCLHHSLPCYVSASKALTVLFEWCCELGRWRNKAQIGQTTCPRTYKKLGNRSQISWDLCSAWLAHWLALLHVWDTFKPATLLGSFCNC